MMETESPYKRRFTSIRLHVGITQKAVIFDFRYDEYVKNMRETFLIRLCSDISVDVSSEIGIISTIIR
jgi:hypothetical protein